MRFVLAGLAVLLVVPICTAQQLTAAQQQQIAATATQVLHDTGVPSASIAIVQGGKVVYAQAFGVANVAQSKPADAVMAYPIGSISKQFTASAALLLQQQGKLSVDDPVAKYFPELTRAKDVKLRNLMTMTSGYEDFAPQDYIIPIWLKNTKPIDIIHEWAEKPLDFEPGTEWQYSNTNYVLLGLIVQKVSGEPLAQFIREHVLTPAHVPDAFNTYTDREKLRVTGYVSVALQPVREQPLEGDGWYFGDGDLAMPASSLAQWDVCVIAQCLLSPASYKQQETAFHYTGGKDLGGDSRYGLGIFVMERGGLRILEHSGEVGGFVAENIVFPDQKAAIVVLTNEVASEAASGIAHNLITLVLGDEGNKALAPAAPSDPFAAELKGILTGFAQGKIDRSLFTADCNSYFDAAALTDFQQELAPLGALSTVERTYVHERGGMTGSVYTATFANGGVKLSLYVQTDGKIEQLLLTGKT